MKAFQRENTELMDIILKDDNNPLNDRQYETYKEKSALAYLS